MRTYLFVLEVEPMRPDVAYPSLALHCTVMHRFKTMRAVPEILAITHEIFAQTAPLLLTAGKSDIFGPSAGPKNIAVNHVVKTSELARFHMRLYDALNGLGVEHTEPKYSGQGYAPHVSAQGDKRLSEGQTHLCTAGYLIEILDAEAPARKYVHARIPFAG